MKIEELLNELSIMVKEAKTVPLTDKIMLSREEVVQILNEMNQFMPTEFKQAKAIVADRQQIIDDANVEAEKIIKAAEEKRDIMLDSEEISALARQKAKELLEDNIKTIDSFKKAANKYIDNIMQQTEDMLSSKIVEVHDVRYKIQQSARFN